MDWKDFVAFHQSTLAADEYRNGVILNVLAHGPGVRPGKVSAWTLGDPGQCAVKITHWENFADAVEEAHWALILGDPTQEQARRLAELTEKDPYPGVIGPEHCAHWFANRASELGIYFREVEAQQIYRCDEAPRYPKAKGYSRLATPEDSQLLADWLTEFSKEAAPFDPVPNHIELEKIAEAGRYLIWEDNSKPVSIAGIVRVLEKTAAITGVYTPVEHRGHGYAGAVTAAITDRIRAMRLTPTLYTDLRSPAANRCYARIGYRPYCPSYHFHR